MDPLVSIIIPAYNIEKYIGKCINSVLEQTYKNIEIIVVNDGSTDRTKAIIKEKAKADKRIRIINQKNAGLSAARNIGIKNAKGDYIVFIDGDDFVENNFLEKLIEKTRTDKSDIVVCSFKTIQNNNETIEKGYNKTATGEEATIQLLLKQDNLDVVTWNKIYKKNLFLDNNIFFPNGEIHEDSLTTYKLYSKAKKVSYIKEPLYLYYKRSGSITTSTKLETSINYKLRASQEAQEYFKNNKQLKEAAEIAELLARYSFIDAMLEKKIPYDEKHNKWIKNNRKRLFKNPFLSKKLKFYIKMLNSQNSFLYKLFRRITL